MGPHGVQRSSRCREAVRSVCGILKIWPWPAFFSGSLVFGVEKQEAEMNAGCACSAVPHPGVAATASFHCSGTSEGWILHPAQLQRKAIDQQQGPLHSCLLQRQTYSGVTWDLRVTSNLTLVLKFLLFLLERML